MSKTLKMSILVIIFTLSFLIFSGVGVNAAEIESVNDFKTLFTGKNVTFNGNTITLNGNVELDDLIDIHVGEYILNLNGNTLKVPEFYVNGGKLTIDDSTKKGKVDVYFLAVNEGATLVINQGIFKTDDVEQNGENTNEINTIIDNWGTLNIKNAIIESGLWNSGTLTVEYAEVPHINQYGKATIKDGKYYSMLTDMDIAETKIYDGEFKGSAEEDYAFIIQSPNPINRYTIDELFPEGYVAKFKDFYPEETEPDSEGNVYYTGVYGPSVEIVKQVDSYSDIFKKITTDTTWTVEGLKPKNFEDSEFIFSAIIDEILEGTGYEGIGYCVGNPDKFNLEEAIICINSEDGKFYEEHKVKVKYVAPNKDTLDKVNTTISNMKNYATHNDMTVESAYRLDDLYLINYLYSNNGTEKVSGSDALNFAKDLIAATNGANISFKFDARAGGSDGDGIYEFAMGQAIVCYNGVPYTSKNAALTAAHVLYIPLDTKDTDDAYIAAAMKRINEYLGSNNGITIKPGKTLESIEHDEDWAKGKKYYELTVNNKTYKFVIVKKDVSKLETPKYIGSDLMSNVSITSDVTTIPLDTALFVEKVTSENIEKVLGTDKYIAFDISLYSKTKKTNITKLDSGSFMVNIPCPNDMEDKDVTVYYITDDGKKIEHKPTVKDGYVTFETDHFSTYVITEYQEDNKLKDKTPDTGAKNNINFVLIISFIGVFGLNLVNRVEKVKIK